MSKPIDSATVKPQTALQDALCEIISAESSLNMCPDPIPDDKRPAPRMGILYLSETDANAAHAIEHMHAAFDLCRKAEQYKESLKTQVYRLVLQLKELGHEPKIKTWLDEPIDGLDF